MRADANTRSAQFLNTPLHLTTIFGNSNVAEVLIKHGADALALDNSGFPVFKLGHTYKTKIPLGLRVHLCMALRGLRSHRIQLGMVKLSGIKIILGFYYLPHHVNIKYLRRKEEKHCFLYI
jgi:ankyrin repeat protein